MLLNSLIYFFARINSFIVKLYKNRYIPYKYNKIANKFTAINIKGIFSTIKTLLNSKRSLSRFGDGEIKWLLNIKKTPGFQKESSLLRDDLCKVLYNKNSNLLIGLPDCFVSLKYNTFQSKYFWEHFCTTYGYKFIKYLCNSNIYYDTSVSRPYMDYNTNYIAKITFKLWKRLWNNKNILIVEGNETHLGVGDDLFSNVNAIRRIECPYINAFESCDIIFNNIINFIKTHKDFIILLSLGPTATILSSMLCNKGYRAIDVGHIDVEYDWYLKGAKEKIDLPYHYVNEVPWGRYSRNVYSNKYKNEIVKIIK